MGNFINEDIRFYKENDPVYYEVDNLPLRDLLENDKALDVTVTNLVKGKVDAPVARKNWRELQPYVSSVIIGDTSKTAIYVRPGNFLARVNSPTETYTGIEEKIPGVMDVNAKTTKPKQAESRAANGVGRTAMIDFKKDVLGGDQFIIPPIWDKTDWKTVNENAWRVDLVFIQAYPSVDQNGDSVATKSQIGYLLGAGIILDGSDTKQDQTSRYTDGQNLKAHMATSSTVSLPGGGLTVDANSTPIQAGIPLPDDLINHAEIAANNAAAQDNKNFMCLPIAYLLIPPSYTNETILLSDSYMVDIRPFFRTSELTLDERQGVVFAEPRADVTNPFATEAFVNAAVAAGNKKDPPKTNDPGMVVLGTGIIRGGRTWGIEGRFPSYDIWGGGWNGDPDWDTIDLRNDPAFAGPNTGGEAWRNYIYHDFESDFTNRGYVGSRGVFRKVSKSTRPWPNMSVYSKKTVNVALPPTYKYYVVEATYRGSVPVASELSQWSLQTPEMRSAKGLGISIAVKPGSFTIITAATWGHNDQRMPVDSNAAGFYPWGYTAAINPSNFTPWKMGHPNGGGEYHQMNYGMNPGQNAGGFMHALPTVQYVVYGVKDNLLTTGGQLIVNPNL